MSTLTVRETRRIDVSAFAKAHPYELVPDRRRFASLALAAQTLIAAEPKDPAAYVRDAHGRVYDRLDCARIVNGGRAN